MSSFKNEAVIKYPVNKVFNVIVDAAKRDFDSFTESEAIGKKVDKTVGNYGTKTTTMTVEITDFKKDSIYEVTSTKGEKIFKSRYTFEPVSNNETKIILEENENTTGFVSGINSLFVSLFFKKRVKIRFNYLVSGLVNEIEKNNNVR